MKIKNNPKIISERSLLCAEDYNKLLEIRRVNKEAQKNEKDNDNADN